MVVAHRSEPDDHVVGTERVNVNEAGVLARALRVRQVFCVQPTDALVVPRLVDAVNLCASVLEVFDNKGADEATMSDH